MPMQGERSTGGIMGRFPKGVQELRMGGFGVGK